MTPASRLALFTMLVVASAASAAPPKTPPAAPASTSGSATGSAALSGPKTKERTLEVRPEEIKKREAPRAVTGTHTMDQKGARVPPAMRAALRSRMDARIDRNLEKIRSLRGEAVGLLTGFVGETPEGSREMPEALLRLGELKWEVEREEFVKRFAEWDKKPEAGRGEAPEPNYKPSRDLFARVLKNYPWFGDYDLALYVDGFLAQEQGKLEESVANFTRILDEYPKSRFRADAFMARGEVYFNAKNDYQAALGEYEQVLKFKGSELYGLALFKSAWCLWRLNRSDEAVRRFVKVFEVTGAKGKSGSERKQLDELEGEALKYLVEVFTEDEKNTAQDMHRFLVQIGGDRFAVKIVKALAETFYEQAHYERGIEAYELLLRLDPANAEAPDWVLAEARGYEQLENYPKLKATYARLLTDYAVGGKWSKTQTDKARVAAVETSVKADLARVAKATHAKAQRDGSTAEFDSAAGFYDVYLQHYGKEPASYLSHFYLGEIQYFRLDKGDEAAVHYMAAARMIPEKEAAVEPGKSLRHDAVYNAIAALEAKRTQELEARKAKKEPYKETETDRRFAEALDLYAKLYPTDPALPELFFRQGRLYYDAGSYDPAVRIFGSLIEKFPSSPRAGPAGELILDAFAKSQNFENVEVWARRLKANPAFKSPDAQKKLDALIVQATFKQGEQLGAAGDHAGAAKAYLRAAKEFPGDPRAAQACVNAETEAQRANDVTTLREASQLLTRGEFQTKPEAPLGAWTAANAFQSLGLYSDAAVMHESIAENRERPNYQKFEHTKDAAFNAVILRTTLGDYGKAIENGNRYLAAYGSSAEADDVAFYMGRAHSRAGRPNDAIALYKKYLGRAKSVDQKARAFVELAILQLQTKDEKGAERSLDAAVGLGKRHKGELGPEGKYAAAHARYMQGEMVLADFEKIKIEGDIKQLAKRLKQKAELLKKAATIFLDTVSLGVAEWTTAALYQIGFTYESFAKALRDAPPPPGLSESDKEGYQAQIDEFVVPMEERSLDAYESGWKKAVELGIYNQWTAKMRESLGRINSELYPPLKEAGLEIRTGEKQRLPALYEAPKIATPAAPAGKGTPATKAAPLPKKAGK